MIGVYFILRICHHRRVYNVEIGRKMDGAFLLLLPLVKELKNVAHQQAEAEAFL